MKPNQHTSEIDWELLAKSVYDHNRESENGSDASLPEELFPDENQREQILKTIAQVDLYFDLKKYPSDEVWQKVEKSIHNRPAKKVSRVRKLLAIPYFRYAAAMVVATVLFVSAYSVIFNQHQKEAWLVISSTNQILNTYTLPDGTQVSLNSNTRLKYPSRFSGSTREVQIEGEAFFQVKPEKTTPFVIHAGNAQIKVLGTSFNVSAYPLKEMVEVIVETGKVQVSNKSDIIRHNNELILDPGEKGTLVYANNSLLKSTNMDPNFLSWKTHCLIFRATSLGEVIGNLEKVYKVNIRLDDPKLNELHLTAQFNDYSLDFILKVIESTFQIEAQKIDGQYILRTRS